MDNDLVVTQSVAQLVDDVIKKGAEFVMEDFRTTSVVNAKLPLTLSESDRRRLKESAAEIRLLIKLRLLSAWLTSDQQQWLHGESDVGPDEYGKWLDAFVGGDRMIRWLYDFTGCLFGDRGCGDAVARCEHCGSAHNG